MTERIRRGLVELSRLGTLELQVGRLDDDAEIDLSDALGWVARQIAIDDRRRSPRGNYRRRRA